MIIKSKCNIDIFFMNLVSIDILFKKSQYSKAAAVDLQRLPFRI